MLALAGALAARGARSESTAPSVPEGFSIAVVAHVGGPRELAAAPNGDLIVGTLGPSVVIVPDAESSPGQPSEFVHLDDAPAAGVAIAGGYLYVGTQFGVWRTAYAPGDRHARFPASEIAKVRPSGISRDHHTTTVAVLNDTLYASVGSSCNACDPDVDATRATIQAMDLDGRGMHAKAIGIRNAIGLAVDPPTRALWAGVAGQDELEHGHPLETFDAVTAHEGVADYGWPHCYDDRRQVDPGRDCSKTPLPLVVFPAYATPIGAAFYPDDERGSHAFPRRFFGAAFVALHGSWHAPPVAPLVAFVPMAGGKPERAVDWSEPDRQWQRFVWGFQAPNGERLGRPTGVAVGSQGSLFVADDKANVIYRIRPAPAP